MRSLLYCYRTSWFNNVMGLAMAGFFVRPLLCPPLDAETFPYERLGEAALVYIALHGLPHSGVLWGDGGVPALAVDGVRNAPRMDGVVVIMEGCYGSLTPFPQAFLERGAQAVVASGNETVDRLRWLGPAGRAGSRIARAIRTGVNVDEIARGSSEFEVIRC